MPVFFPPTLHQLHTNRYAVVGVMPMFVLLRSRIGNTNRYEVVSAIPMFVFLRPRIGHTNRYAVVGVMPAFFIPPSH